MTKTETTIVTNELSTSNARLTNKVVASASTIQIVNITAGDATPLRGQAKMSLSEDLFITSNIEQLVLE